MDGYDVEFWTLVYIERLIRYLISDRSSRYLLLSIPIYPRSRCQIFVSLCPGQVSPGSCDQLRVSWSWPHSRLKLLRVLSTVQISGILAWAVTLLQCYTRPAGGMRGMLGTTHNTALTARNETGSSSYV